MTDDPDKIMAELQEKMGETHDILPFLKESGQFHIGYCMFIREKPKCENCDKIIDHGETLCNECEN